MLNTVIGIVGPGEKFTILEGDAVAPYLLELAAVPRSATAAVEEEAEAAEGGAAGGAAAPHRGAVEPGDAPHSMDVS